MFINTIDPIIQTVLFSCFFIAAIVLSTKKDPGSHEMNKSHTNELKGIAILMIIFGHIGYFLFNDHRFLYPLSVASGVGVNLFLFLSGFGLTVSAIKKELPIVQFYKKRFKNIFIPMWIALILILILDAVLVSRTYDANVIILSFLGLFTEADINISINSPLWYFTNILFYYLIFPIIFYKNKPLLSIGLVILISLLILNLNLPVTKDVLKLYWLHYLAFPIGMSYAYLFKNKENKNLNKSLQRMTIARPVLLTLLSILFVYTVLNSGIGENVVLEQAISIIAMICVLLINKLKKVQSGLFVLLGTYSYEIYLIHWPIMSRFDFIYKYTPAFLGTILYIIVFVIVGFILNRIVNMVFRNNDS